MNVVYFNLNSGIGWQSIPEKLHLDGCACALYEISGKVSPSPPSPVFICADFIQRSSAGEKHLPILRRLQFSRGSGQSGTIRKVFNKMIWIPVTRSPISEMKLHISDEQGDILSFDSCQVNCTLVFLRTDKIEDKLL